MIGRRIYWAPTSPNDPTEERFIDLDSVTPGCFYQDGQGEWRGMTPNGLRVWLKNHHVEEHEDDTISVVAGPWGSNSILVTNGIGNKNWHGYIRRGVWEEC